MKRAGTEERIAGGRGRSSSWLPQRCLSRCHCPPSAGTGALLNVRRDAGDRGHQGGFGRRGAVAFPWKVPLTTQCLVLHTSGPGARGQGRAGSEDSPPACLGEWVGLCCLPWSRLDRERAMRAGCQGQVCCPGVTRAVSTQRLCKSKWSMRLGASRVHPPHVSSLPVLKVPSQEVGEAAGPPAQRPNTLWAKDLDVGQKFLGPSASEFTGKRCFSRRTHTRKKPAPFLPWSSDSFHETISEM